MPRNFMFGKKKRGTKKRGRHAVCADDINTVETTDNSSAGPALDESTETDAVPSVTEVDVDGEMPLPANDRNNVDTVGTENSLPDEQDQSDGLLNDSTAKRKYSLYEEDLSSMPNTMGSFFLMHMSFLVNMLSKVCCPTCFESQLVLREGAKKGLAQYFSLICQSCDSVIWKSATSPYTKNRFDINYRTVLGCKETGVSHQRLNRLFSLINMRSPFHKKTLADIRMEIHRAAVDAAENSMVKAANLVRQKHASGELISSRESATGLDVISVSFDGTWQRRGHSSHNGAGVAISMDTGLVLDYQVLSNYCHACETGPKPTDNGYREWRANHEQKCQMNHTESANSMEARTAEHIFSRSAQQRQLIYGTMLCDGDSKVLVVANQHSGYDIPVLKEDCINHITKRMFNGLEACRKQTRKP